MIAAAMDDATNRGEGGGLSTLHFANAVLLNGLAKYEDALAAAREATAYPVEYGVANWALPELVEAAARSGRPELAVDGLEPAGRDGAGVLGTEWGARRAGPVEGPADQTAGRRNRRTRRRSSVSAGRGCGWTLPGLTWCTANGFDGRDGGRTRGSSCGRRTRCSPRPAPTPSPTARAVS